MTNFVELNRLCTIQLTVVFYNWLHQQHVWALLGHHEAYKSVTGNGCTQIRQPSHAHYYGCSHPLKHHKEICSLYKYKGPLLQLGDSQNPNTRLEHIHHQLAAPQSFTAEITVRFFLPALRNVKFHSSNVQCTHWQQKCNNTDRQRHRNQNARKLRQNRCISGWQVVRPWMSS